MKKQKKRHWIRWIVFGIPSIIWILLSCILLNEDKANPGAEPITVFDVVLTDFLALLIWFVITFTLSWIFNKIISLFRKKKYVCEQYPVHEPEQAKASYTNQRQESYQEENDEIPDKILMPEKAPENQGNQEYLYRYEGIVDAEEYKKLLRSFPKKFFWKLFALGTIILVVSACILFIFEGKYLEYLLIFLMLDLCYLLFLKFRQDAIAEKIYNFSTKKRFSDSNQIIEFYQDFLIRKGNTLSLTIQYCDIAQCVETETNFYLEIAQKNHFVIIQKNRCEEGLIQFIRNTLENRTKVQFEKRKPTGVQKHYNYGRIRIFMIILFILTILSFFAAAKLDSYLTPEGMDFLKNMWIFWCWLPIPVLSIVLGFKYRKIGIPCVKNIVAGFIVTFFLIVFGSFCLLPIENPSDLTMEAESVEYSEIIGMELPKPVTVTAEEVWNPFLENKTELVSAEFVYGAKDSEELVAFIKHSDRWMKGNEIDDDLRLMMPEKFPLDENMYVLIYNQINGAYNTPPTADGTYKLYVMKYDMSVNSLEVHQLNYDYKQEAL
ncbi:MAG: hypothetical protein ACI4GE_10930 [Lachnospiraceae bacterium]